MEGIARLWEKDQGPRTKSSDVTKAPVHNKAGMAITDSLRVNVHHTVGPCLGPFALLFERLGASEME